MRNAPRTAKFCEDTFIKSAIGPYERGFNDGLRKAGEFCALIEEELGAARGILKVMRDADRISKPKVEPEHKCHTCLWHFYPDGCACVQATCENYNQWKLDTRQP